MTRGTRTSALFAALLLLFAACSSTDPASVAEHGNGKKSGSEPGGNKKSERQGGRNKKEKTKEGDRKNDGAASTSRGDGSGAEDPSGGGDGGAGTTEGSGENDNGSPDLSRAVASRGDSSSDGEGNGDTPIYADMTRASIKGNGQSVELTVTFAETVPQVMPDGNTFMAVGFRFEGKRNKPYVYADGDKSGWTPGINSSESYPGEFSVSGNKMVFTLPWAALGGAQKFKWYANDSWVKSGLVTTSYLFDEVPNLERAHYP
jgi:hypothetical protein